MNKVCFNLTAVLHTVHGKDAIVTLENQFFHFAVAL